ncbi:hypothetical protein [Bradyrhizobium diazoefficiens]
MNTSSEQSAERTRLVAVIFVVLVLSGFAADLATGYGFHLSDLYSVAVLAASRSAPIRLAKTIASLGFILILLSAAMATGPLTSSIASAVISMVLLGAATVFVSCSSRGDVPPRMQSRDKEVTPAEGQTTNNTHLLINELRQPLSVLLSDGRATLSWLKREQPNLPEVMHCAQRIATNASRAAEILSLLAYQAIRNGSITPIGSPPSPDLSFPRQQLLPFGTANVGQEAPRRVRSHA